ncbi:hypothetical protein [Actinacidiphila yeochonensis]|uniref:hypothetical protein n=1 Tax=Actinacidiphila yeochonensis TaxID=89050 RepID=UPI0005653F44|nr:hypothetical protein [Actinacidiphila yeochonensis]
MTVTLERSVVAVEQGRPRWSVSSYRRHGDLELHEYTTHRLDSADGVREHYRLASERPWVSRIEITEITTAVLRRPITEGQLPGPGRLTSVDAAPPQTAVARARRFFAVEPGPQELPTGDAVRAHLAWLPCPQSVRLWECTEVLSARPVGLDDLPSDT